MHDLTVIAAHSRSAHPQAAAGPAKADPLGSSISNSTVAGRFDLLTRKIEALLEAFEIGTNNTQRMVDLMAFGPRMKEISERTLDEIKAQGARSSDQQRILQNLIEVSMDSVKASHQLIEIQQLNKDNSDETLQAIKSLAGSEIFFSQRKDQEFRDRLFTEMKSLITLQSDNKKLVQNLIEVGGNNARGIDNIAQIQKDTKNEFGTLVGRLIESIQKVEEVDVSGARHLYEIKERLIKLCNNMGVIDIIATGISGQNVLLETLVEEVRGKPEDTELANLEENMDII
jgi:hypothetical protein